VKSIRQWLYLAKVFLHRAILGGVVVGAMLYWGIHGTLELIGVPLLSAIVITALYVLFVLAAMGLYIGSDILATLRTANKELESKKLRARSLHEIWVITVAEQFAATFLFVILAIVLFALLNVHWAAAYPDLFTLRGDRREVTCFVMAGTPIELITNGVCQGEVRAKFMFASENALYHNWRFFYGFLMIVPLQGLVKLATTYHLVNKLPDYRRELRRLARYLDRDGDG